MRFGRNYRGSPAAASANSSSERPRPPGRESDEVADERRVDPLAALVRGHPRERQQRPNLGVRERVVPGFAVEPRDRFFEPGIHWRRTYSPAQLRLRAMKIGVPKETASGEQRVALVPDGVRRQTESGVDVLVETGAGEAAAYPDATYTDAGAQIVSADDLYAQADLVLRIGKVDGVGALAKRPDACRLPPAARRDRVGQGARRARRHELLHGRDPAHHARAADGRALLAGDGRRLQGGADRRRLDRQVLPDAHDRGRDDPRPRRSSCSAPASRGCRRSRPRGGSARWSRPTTCGRP